MPCSVWEAGRGGDVSAIPCVLNISCEDLCVAARALVDASSSESVSEPDMLDTCKVIRDCPGQPAISTWLLIRLTLQGVVFPFCFSIRDAEWYGMHKHLMIGQRISLIC